jgi:hypothetical protein
VNEGDNIHRGLPLEKLRLRILGGMLGEKWERELQRCTARELKNYVKTGSIN